MEKAIPVPKRIIRDQVDPFEVARYYLEAELGNVVGEAAARVTVPTLDEQQVWRLLEALSVAYRLNGTLWFVGGKMYNWQEVVIDPATVKLLGLNATLNPILALPEVDWEAGKFAVWLASHREDPAYAKEVAGFYTKPSGLLLPKIILRDYKDQLVVLDGIHRLMAQMLEGQTEITAYYGVKTGSDRIMVGYSTFWFLARVWRRAATPEAKQTVLDTVLIIARDSTDGAAAIQTCWIDHGNAEEQVTGRILLEKLAESQPESPRVDI